LHFLDLFQIRFGKDPVGLRETSVLCHEGSKRIPDLGHVLSRQGITIQVGEAGKDRLVRLFRNISECRNNVAPTASAYADVLKRQIDEVPVVAPDLSAC
jgi:hypothetical protein